MILLGNQANHFGGESPKLEMIYQTRLDGLPLMMKGHLDSDPDKMVQCYKLQAQDERLKIQRYTQNGYNLSLYIYFLNMDEEHFSVFFKPFFLLEIFYLLVFFLRSLVDTRTRTNYKDNIQNKNIHLFIFNHNFY